MSFEGLRESSCSLNTKDPDIPKKLLEVPPLLVPANNGTPPNDNSTPTPPPTLLLGNHDSFVNTPPHNPIASNNSNVNHTNKNGTNHKAHVNTKPPYSKPPSSPSPSPSSSAFVKYDQQFQEYNPQQNGDNNIGNGNSYFMDQFNSEEFANDVLMLEEMAKTPSFPSSSNISVNQFDV